MSACMPAATPRDYRTIAGRLTRYEITVDGVPVAYTARRTRQSLFNVAWDAADWIGGEVGDVVRFLWDSKLRQFSCVKEGSDIPPVIVRFSGRTEREASYAIHGNAS